MILNGKQVFMAAECVATVMSTTECLLTENLAQANNLARETHWPRPEEFMADDMMNDSERWKRFLAATLRKALDLLGEGT